MNPLDALNHLANFFLPAAMVGMLGAALAKLCWRRELKPVPWHRLAGFAVAAGAAASVVGLLYFGRDGRMATYVGIVLASAAGLWWAGFGARR